MLRGRGGGCQIWTLQPLCHNPWHPSAPMHQNYFQAHVQNSCLSIHISTSSKFSPVKAILANSINSQLCSLKGFLDPQTKLRHYRTIINANVKPTTGIVQPNKRKELGQMRAQGLSKFHDSLPSITLALKQTLCHALLLTMRALWT